MLKLRLALLLTVLGTTGCPWSPEDSFGHDLFAHLRERKEHHPGDHGWCDLSPHCHDIEEDASAPLTDGGCEDAGATDAGQTCDGASECGDIVWPNAEGPANSSAWLRQNHQRVTELRPRVLVLDVWQQPGFTPIEEFVPAFVAALEEQTRYHGYSDPTAKPFIRYQVDRIVDLKDPGGAEYPDSWPVVDNDVGALFTEEFAPFLGYRAPDDPNRFMPMCELFERGLIHELWIAAGGGRNLTENESRVQVYDDQLQPLPGQFSNCTNGCFNDPLQRVNCKVTVRMQELNKGRGVGCGTHAAEHTIENMRGWIPYIRENADRFFGFDLDKRYGLTVDSLYGCPYYTANNDCVQHPMPNVMVSGVDFPGAAFRIDDWGAACGNNHFPPNGRFQYDYDNLMPALSTCPSYGLGGNPDGSDVRSEYTAVLGQAYDAEVPDCGGGWITYLQQSFPGYGNRAKDAHGQPMLNWWPFVFY